MGKGVRNDGFKKKNISDEAIYRLVDNIYKNEIKEKIEEPLANSNTTNS